MTQCLRQQVAQVGGRVAGAHVCLRHTWGRHTCHQQDPCGKVRLASHVTSLVCVQACCVETAHPFWNILCLGSEPHLGWPACRMCRAQP